MKVGVLILNFGEPENATLEEVVPFLERIFARNASLEPGKSAESRAHKLAKDRAPGLIEEFKRIGGSPLNVQARKQPKNHRSLALWMSSSTTEYISYTYRF